MTPADLIKPLVWETSHQATTPIHVARSVLGEYSVHGGAWKNGMFPLSSPGVIPSSWHETIEIAQAAAQAHHVAAVTACIDPDAIARIRADALREAATKATSFLVGDPKNDIPLRNPMAHEIAAAILDLIPKEKDDE